MVFCADECVIKKSLAPLTGPEVMYTEKWYDKEGKPVSKSKDESRRDEPEVELTDTEKLGDDTPLMPAPATKTDVPLDGEAEAEHKEESKSKSSSESDDSHPGSGSKDSSPDSEYNGNSSSQGSKAQSDADSNVSTRKTRQRKKKPRPPSDEESDAKSHSETVKISDNPEETAKTEGTPKDSGIGEGATAMAHTSFSGDGVASVLGTGHRASFKEVGAVPLPTTLPSMATLEALTDDLEKLSGKLFQSLE